MRWNEPSSARLQPKRSTKMNHCVRSDEIIAEQNNPLSYYCPKTMLFTACCNQSFPVKVTSNKTGLLHNKMVLIAKGRVSHDVMVKT